jgi:hypothetical protein
LLVPVNAFSISISEIENKLLYAQSEEDVEKILVEVVKSSEYQKACQLLFDKINSMSPLETQADAEKALPTLRDYENLQCRWTQDFWGDAPKQYTPSQCDELVSKFDEYNEKFYDINKQRLIIENEQGKEASQKYYETSEWWYSKDKRAEVSSEFHQFCLPRDDECEITSSYQNTLNENFTAERYEDGSKKPTFEYKLFLEDNSKFSKRQGFLCGFANNITQYYETQEKYFDIPTPTVITSSEIACGNGTIENAFGQCVPDSTNKSSKGGGCLIATATYGSELAPQVQQLRELRDNQLLNTESGTSFMKYFNDFYYSFSPIMADYERENPVFREMVKMAITPMVSSLSILNYVNMDSESSVLGYGISLIILNVMMYVGVPILAIMRIRK